MQIKFGSWKYVFYFNFIIFSWWMGWWDAGSSLKTRRHRVRDWRPLGTGQMDGRWIQENDGHCVRNCKQDGTTSISGWSLRVTDKSTLQGELEGGRNCFLYWKDTCAANTGKDSCVVDTSLLMTAVTYWIMHAQYFALINLYLKRLFIVIASFSLLLILLATNDQQPPFKLFRSGF